MVCTAAARHRPAGASEFTNLTKLLLASLGSAPCSLPLVSQVPFLSHALVTREVACGGCSAAPRASVNTDPTSGHPHPSVLAGAGVAPCGSFLLAKHPRDHQEGHAAVFCALSMCPWLVTVSPCGCGTPPATSLSLPSSRAPRAAPEDAAITALPPVRRCRGVAGAGPGGTDGVMWRSVTRCPGQALLQLLSVQFKFFHLIHFRD